MSDQNYEEGYFKLKKANEDLSLLINKVLNDFKQAKTQLSSEKDKNSVVTKRNNLLEKQLTEITNKCKDHQQELEDLRDEVASLKMYTKAVEGVAENYCDQTMKAASKYNNLKRKSTLIFSKLQVDNSLNINLDEPDEIISPGIPKEHIPDLMNIKNGYEETLAKEEEKKVSLRNEIKELKIELESFKSEIKQLTLQLEEKSRDAERLNEDISILSDSYEVIKKDNDAMMECFRPFQKIKNENLELKRTSCLIINDLDSDGRMKQFSDIMEELRNENISLNCKVKELESGSNSTNLEIEISALNLQLVEANDKISAIMKERNTLKHENRILQEQKGGPGLPPPPPPAPPPPPPPNINKILRLFKGKTKLVVTTKAENLEEKKVADMMLELQRKLEEKVRNAKKMPNNFPTFVHQQTVDSTDYISPKIVRLRSASMPGITPINTQCSELEKIWGKMGKINEEI